MNHRLISRGSSRNLLVDSSSLPQNLPRSKHLPLQLNQSSNVDNGYSVLITIRHKTN